ncbi:YdeI/OmpD-associated family protein [Desertivirga arenae]|uniref:YdeI/OmpD-associated family protein n=1 Tax=Desertivirga arenae TaxID=2810309 RepID=UPI001A966569|nr:YdeI/OmpD-associated family protein [Pedobacter sp. SYSU D00823]
MEKLIVDSELLLQKFPGKGGWTYAEILDVSLTIKSSFGWVRVKGRVDHIEIKDCNLAPMKGGKLFLPVNAQLRKKLGKEAGDVIKVILFENTSPVEVPSELLECLKLEEQSYQKFEKLSASSKKEYLKWIYSAKNEDTKAERINEMINKLFLM